MFLEVIYKAVVLIALTSFTLGSNAADIVMKDSGIEVSKQELEHAIKYWPDGLRKNAVDNNEQRFDLLNNFMVNRKIAEEMKKVSRETDPEFYWQREFAIRNLQNKLYKKHYRDTLKVPDMTDLAKEKYYTHKEKYIIPEKRKASHILIKCLARECERKDMRPVAETVLKKLKDGEKFEKLVEEYSGDPGSKARQGVLKSWIKKGQPHMDGYFVEGLYSIEKVGGYSDIIETRFGFHIIRFDDVEEITNRPESEVVLELAKKLEAKFRNLSFAALTTRLNLSKDAFLDDEILSELLSEYKVKDVPKSGKRELIIKKVIRE